MDSTHSVPASSAYSTSGSVHAPVPDPNRDSVQPTHRAFHLNERLLAARRGQRKADFQLALLLAELAEDRLFLDLGYSSLVNYAEQVLELSPRTTRELLLLGRRLPGLPVLTASLESGELDWTKAREIVRVTTADTESAWVERAKGVTSRVLEAEVATSLVGELPPDGEPEPERRPERQRVVFEMDSADAEVLRTALTAIRGMTHVGRDDIGDGALLGALARRMLVTIEEEAVQFAEAGAEPHAPTGERYRVVLEHCPTCRRTIAPEAKVSGATAAEAMCDAEVLDMRPGREQGHVTRAVPEVTRRKVFHRAHWKCEVPGCRNRLWLDIHHMQPRATGGKHDLDNLAAVCCAHHRCIHMGTLGLELKCEVIGPGRARASGQGSRILVVSHAVGREEH